MEELRKFLPQKVIVRRAAEDCEVAADRLVPGDVILIREGDKVPADARLVEGNDLIVNNAPLTGEAIPLPIGIAAHIYAVAWIGLPLIFGLDFLRKKIRASLI